MYEATSSPRHSIFSRDKHLKGLDPSVKHHQLSLLAKIDIKRVNLRMSRPLSGQTWYQAKQKVIAHNVVHKGLLIEC